MCTIIFNTFDYICEIIFNRKVLVLWTETKKNLTISRVFLLVCLLSVISQMPSSRWLKKRKKMEREVEELGMVLMILLSVFTKLWCVVFIMYLGGWFSCMKLIPPSS